MASKEYTEVMLKLPALSVESLEYLQETIKEHLKPSSPQEGHPLDELHYWHADDYPEDWGEEFCKSLANLTTPEVFDTHVKAAKLLQRKQAQSGAAL